MDLDEVCRSWDIGFYRVYGAAARGAIKAYGRPGHQKFYSYEELVKTFGEPTVPPTLSPRYNGWPELGEAAA